MTSEYRCIYYIFTFPQSKTNSTAVAELRQGQMAALKLQNVAMATAAVSAKNRVTRSNCCTWQVFV